MADPQPVERWLQKHHFLLRRLHSLLGIIPIGAFLIEHMLTNSLAWLGPEKFNKQVRWLHELPWLLALETVFIFLPIAFHAIYGLAIVRQARHNVTDYPYMDNWRFALQRWTGVIALIFIIAHLGHFRFAYLLGGAEYVGAADPFALTAAGFSWGLPAPVWIPIYAIGMVSAIYHFTNGIVTFCITWGITVGVQARKRVSVVAALLGLVMVTWGALSLVAFGSQAPAYRETTTLHAAAPAVPAQHQPGGAGH